MLRVAKLVIVDNEGQYLMLYRSAHPKFGDGPDLPGGTLEDGEGPLDAMIREVQEELGIIVAKPQARHIFTGTNYSRIGTEYNLYLTELDPRPKVTLSWEHSGYEWLDKDEFFKQCLGSTDQFLVMAYEQLSSI